MSDPDFDVMSLLEDDGELYCEREGFYRYSPEDRKFARSLERAQELVEEYE